MPILYACLINNQKAIVFEGFEPKFKGNFKKQVQEQEYALYGKKTIDLDEELSLHYSQEGTWSVVCISQKPDVTLYEAFNFLEKVKEAMKADQLLSDDAQVQGKDAESKFKAHGKQLTQFIKQWNEDPDNRDKAYVIFQELLEQKEQMLQNLNLVNDRDLLLDIGVEKTKQLATTSKTLKTTTKKVKQKMARRRCMLYLVSISGVIIIIAGIVLMLVLWTQNSKNASFAERALCCFRSKQIDNELTMNIKTLTCNKLSHCLFDFDCVDLNVYEKETYNFLEFTIDNIGTESNTVDNVSNDSLICREALRIWIENTQGCKVPQRQYFMRVLFKPDTQTLWGYHHVNYNHPSTKAFEEQDFIEHPGEEEENDVDMQRTMWQVLRKTKPTNNTLKVFFAEAQPFKIKHKDIIKFGRVNFKVTEIKSSKLKKDIQGTVKTMMTQPSQVNLVTQVNNPDRIQVSQVSMNVTDMNLLDHSQQPSSLIGNNQSQIQQMNLNSKSTRLASPQKQLKITQAHKNEKEEILSAAQICRICLGEEEDPENELICPCNCSGTMQYIHNDCLREWLNGKKLVYQGERVRSYFWKALECELCKQPFENKMKDKLFQVMEFDRPDNDFMIMESVKSAPAKVVHVFYLGKSNEFKIGRSVDTDMKIADISVSRVHAFIRIQDQQIYIEDNGSKFGTLVKINEPTEIAQGGPVKRLQNLYQIGRTLIFLGLQYSGGKAKSKGARKGNRKIESIQNSQIQDEEYVQTLSGRYIPAQFMRSIDNDKFEKGDQPQQQLSQMMYHYSKPQTGRSVSNNNSKISSPVSSSERSNDQESGSQVSQSQSQQSNNRASHHREESKSSASQGIVLERSNQLDIHNFPEEGGNHSSNQDQYLSQSFNQINMRNAMSQARSNLAIPLELNIDSSMIENQSEIQDQMHYSQIVRNISPRRIQELNFYASQSQDLISSSNPQTELQLAKPNIEQQPDRIKLNAKKRASPIPDRDVNGIQAIVYGDENYKEELIEERKKKTKPSLSLERKTVHQFQTVQAYPEQRADSQMRERATAQGRYKSLVDGGVIHEQPNDVTSNAYQDDQRINDDSGEEEYKDKNERKLNRQMTNDHDSPRKNKSHKTQGMSQNQLGYQEKVNNSKSRDNFVFKESQDTLANDMLASTHKRYKTILIQQSQKEGEGRLSQIMDKSSERDSNFQQVVVINKDQVKLHHNRRNYNENY